MNRRRSVVIEPRTEVIEIGTPPPPALPEATRAARVADLQTMVNPSLAEKLLKAYENLMKEPLPMTTQPPVPVPQWGWSPQQPLFGLPQTETELITADKTHFMSLQQWLVEPVPMQPVNEDAVESVRERILTKLLEQAGLPAACFVSSPLK